MSPPPPVVWVDGSLGDEAGARIAALDRGFTVGDGVFETIRVARGRPVFWTRHLRRLHHGLQVVGLEDPDDDGAALALDEQLRAGAEAVLAHRAGPDARLRLTVTSGPGPLGPRRSPGPLTTVVAAADTGPTPTSITACTVRWARNERSVLAGVKSTSYGEGVALLDHASRMGADEAILADTTGRLSEAVTANVFVAVDGRLATPGLDTGCLAGTVRDVVLEAGLATEHDLPIAVLHDADEVFVTSATRGVVPVSIVDAHPVPSVGGPLTLAAREAYDRAVDQDLVTDW
ncbi:aminotransferase class IV [Rhabdothermincola salaria]|uniref:aminotransferase class IV n=1 Tax=Rhabdothermincola salaria TaxID=2903142 RepID=UPI001E2D6745|nr:aminotransferase class IV [Rhabdothermincola salaria]MCD9623352.1 aminotransferase class IV [Rhabdothermincola salaria]